MTDRLRAVHTNKGHWDNGERHSSGLICLRSLARRRTTSCQESDAVRRAVLFPALIACPSFRAALWRQRGANQLQHKSGLALHIS